MTIQPRPDFDTITFLGHNAERFHRDGDGLSSAIAIKLFRNFVDRSSEMTRSERALKSVLMAVDTRKRIVLIDDHTLLREGVQRLLTAGDEFVICEEAGSAAEGIERVREIRPDGVVLDVELPGGTDGIELAKQFWGEFPELVVVILSAHDEPDYAQRAAEAGAMGYILKSDAAETLRTALRDAFRGRRTFPGSPAAKAETFPSRDS